MGARRVLAALVLTCLLFGAASAAAQLGPPPPRVNHWRLASTVGLGANELIGGWIARPYIYIPYGDSENWLFEQAHVKVGPTWMVSPEIARAGASVGVSPALFLDLDLSYFTILDWSGKIFDSAHAAYDPHHREQIETEFVTGHMVTASATVKAAYKRLVMVSITEGTRWDVPEYYFDIEINAILEPGFSIRNQTILGCQLSEKLFYVTLNDFFHFYPSAYEKDSLLFGLMINNLIPDSQWLIAAGFHLENPDFTGIKFLTAVLSDFQLSGPR